MYPSFLVKNLCYSCRPFINILALSAYMCIGPCLILKHAHIFIGDVEILEIRESFMSEILSQTINFHCMCLVL